MLSPHRVRFLFLNLGHAYDHLFMLLFPTVVLALEDVFHRPYDQLLPLSVAGFIAFGAGSVPAGWLADRWSRSGMMTLFFIGLGGAAIVTGLAQGPISLAAGLGLIGLFASIYHPVGIALVVEDTARAGRSLGINGVWGNMGVAGAAVIAGGLVDLWGWRAAFIVPGGVAVATGLLYRLVVREDDPVAAAAKPSSQVLAVADQRRVLMVIAVSTLLGGLVFHATTVSLPKVFDVRLAAFADSTFAVGGLASVVYAVAAFTQIVVGHLIDRFSLRTVFLGIVSLQVPVFAVAAVIDGGAMLLVATAVMMLVFGEIPILDALVARHVSGAWRSRVYGIKYFLSLSVSAAAVPMVSALHAGTGGFAAMFLVLAAFAAVIAVAALTLPMLAAPARVPA
jgi:MFS family permease